MTKDQILNKLPNDGINVLLELFNCIISVDDFFNRFSSSSLDYTSLITNSNTTAGWRQQFDSWHSQGII